MLSITFANCKVTVLFKTIVLRESKIDQDEIEIEVEVKKSK